MLGVKSQGRGDGATLLSLGNLVSTMKKQGNSRPACNLFQDALESASKIPLGEFERAGLFGHLANLLLECGLYDVAGHLSYNVMQSSISSYGADHLLSMKNMRDLATALNCQGHFAGATMLYRRVFERLERKLGTFHPDTLEATRRLADSLRCQLHDQDSIRLLKASLKLQETAHGYPLETPMMKTSLGVTYALKGLWNDAEALMVQALDGYQELHGLNREWTSWTTEILEIIRSLRTSQSQELEGETEFSKLIGTTTPYLGLILEAFPLRYEDTDSPFITKSDRAIVVAAANGDYAKVEANLREAKTKDGIVISRALRAAAANHQLEVVRLILDSSVSANEGGAFYGSSLQAAAFSDDRAIVELLIDRKADINQQGGVFGAALQATIISRNENMLCWLINLVGLNQIFQDTLDSALCTAVLIGEEGCVVELLDAGARINAADNLVGTVLQ